MKLTRVEATRLNKAIEQVAKLDAPKLGFEDSKSLSFMIGHTAAFVKGVLKYFGLLENIEGEDENASLEFDAETLGRFSLSCIMYGIALGRYYEKMPECGPTLQPWSMSSAYEHFKNQDTEED